MTLYYRVRVAVSRVAPANPARYLGTIELDGADIPTIDGRGTAAGIVARFAEEGLRATVAPINDDGTVPSLAVVTVYGPLTTTTKGRVTA